MSDFKIPKSNLLWLQNNTIFLTEHGSRAYGTNVATSDTDYKGVCIPPRKYHLGYLEQFHQAEFRDPHPDMVIYDLRKFFKLAADCNPSIIEVLFTEPRNHVIVTPIGQTLLEHRDLFISKKAKHTFGGYAVGQLKRIKGHYKWLKNPPKAPPTRAEFGLPETTVIPADQLKAAEKMIAQKVAHWNVPVDELDPAAKIAVQERFIEALALIEIGYKAQVTAALHAAADLHPIVTANDYIRAEGFMRAQYAVESVSGVNLENVAGKLLGYSDNFLQLLAGERAYKSKMDEWHSYLDWQKNRNPDRSALEAKYGYDTKHGMHLVRLLRMGREILEGKGVIVYRPDREELLEIRAGNWSYERLLEYADKELAVLDELYNTGAHVPGAPDRILLDSICQILVNKGFEQYDIRRTENTRK